MSLSLQTADFFESRLLRLAQLVQQSFLRLLSDTPADQILGWGLATDAAAQRLVPTIYRRHDHAANLADAQTRYQDSGVDWDLYLRWTPVEWPRSTATAPTTAVPELGELWQELLDRRAPASGVDRTYWPSIMFEAAANAMIVLHRDGWFDKYAHSVRVLHVIEGRIDRVTRRRWVEAMNADLARQSYLSHERQFVGAAR